MGPTIHSHSGRWWLVRLNVRQSHRCCMRLINHSSGATSPVIPSAVRKRRVAAALLGLPLAIFADGHASVHIGAGKRAYAVFHTPQCWHETTQYTACRVPDLPDIKITPEHGRYIFRQIAGHVSIGYEYPRGASPQDSGHLEKFVVPGEKHYESIWVPHPQLRAITQDEWSSQAPRPFTARAARTARAFYPESDTTVRAIDFAGPIVCEEWPPVSFQ